MPLASTLGLSRPHSPRLHQIRLWLLNSGTGEFGRVKFASGTIESVALCPGYARGLAFAELGSDRDLRFGLRRGATTET